MKKKFFTLLLLFLLIVYLPALAQKEPSIQINVEGIQDPLKEKMVTLLADRSQDIPSPITEVKVRIFYAQSTLSLKKGLQAYGYFQPQIQSRLEKTGNNWTLWFTINPGPPTKIAHVDLKITGAGATDSAFIKLSKNLSVKKGQILNIDHYNEAKDALFNLAANRGYFDAKMFLNQIIINTGSKEASIVLHFDTGQRYRFGPTLFPASDLNTQFLQRFLRYKPGEYYSSAKVQKTQQVMAGSGFFSQTVVTPLTHQASDHTVPIKIELTPVKPRRYTIGLGYGTDTGPRGTLGFNWIPINSYGHHLNILARGSYLNTGSTERRNNSINASYIIPGADPANDSYAITTGYGDISQDTGTANSFKTALSYNTILNEDWQQILALTYLNERYRLTDTPQITADVLYPSGHWQYIRNRSLQKNQIINNGISASFDIAGASEDILSRSSFIQGKASLKALGTFEPTHTRFLFRSQVGRTQIENLENLPLTLQLFAGGPTSIRGFKYNSLGPGRNLLIVSGEIQQRIYHNWYLAGFIDTGAVTDSDIPLTQWNSYVAGAGGGVVVLTPIGAVELDVARPVINGHSQKTWQLEFSVGAEL